VAINLHDEAQNVYALVPEELALLRAMLNFQHTYRDNVTSSDVGRFFTILESLSDAYPGIKNPKCQGWFKSLFDELVKVSNVDIMFQVFRYRRYVRDTGIEDCWDRRGETKWHNWWYTYHHGWEYWDQNDQTTRIYPEVGLPAGPDNWKNKAQAVLDKWKDNNPEAQYIDKGAVKERAGVAAVHKFEDDVIAKWTEKSSAIAKTKLICTTQKTDLQALQQLNSMDSRSYLFLLHLLIGLSTGNTKMTTFVNKLVVVKTDTDAYPEEKFINQLTYFVLMYLGDAREPDEKYGWNNGQLQAFVKDLKGIIYTGDGGSPGAQAIAKSLDLQLRLLTSISSYPLIDPESSQPLSERKSSTRAALNKALKSITIEA